ncbi:hypothetical protein ACP4OV_030270 [Aristida adscensionis]
MERATRGGRASARGELPARSMRQTEGEEAGREFGEQTETSTLEPQEIEYGVQEITEERSSGRKQKRLTGADARLSWTPGHTWQIVMVRIMDASSIPRC